MFGLAAAIGRFLGANVRYTDGRDVPWIQDDTMIVRGKLKIGVIGVASILTATTTRAANVSNLKFADPAPIVDRLAQEVRKAMSRPEVQAQLAAQGLDPVTNDPESFKMQIDRELNRWTRDLKTMNIGLN